MHRLGRGPRTTHRDRGRVKLLFDANLSVRLVEALGDVFDEALHVRDVGLGSASDHDIWEFAGREGAVIVTCDSDFNDLAALRGWPPKVVWLRLGNVTTIRIEEALRNSAGAIVAFGDDASAGLLAIMPSGTRRSSPS